jgi:GNAT superfamily N-acetyltransferase
VTYIFRRATGADTDAVVGLLAARTDWLRQKGHEQWSAQDPARDSADTIAAGQTWILWDDTNSEAIATLTMSTAADPDFWTQDEVATPALYLSKLASRPDIAGRGFGALLVHAAARYAGERGISALRWDVWKSNHGLQAYYLRLGATLLRIVDASGRRSGALFEWAYRRTPRDAQRHLPHFRLDAPTHVVTELEADICQPPVILVDPGAYTDPAPEHWHVLTDLCLAWPEDARPSPPPISVSPWTGDGGAVLFHAGDVWRTRAAVSGRVTGTVLERLTAGRPYRLAHDDGTGICRAVLIGDAVAESPRPPVAQASAEATPW